MAKNLDSLILQLSKKLLERNWQLVTAESCTGGGLAYAFTNLSGSSSWFERGLVTYSNSAKQELLGVKTNTLSEYGAVSEETAKEMALGALTNSHAQISIAVTGIAGPDGGSAQKPVGTVWVSICNVENKTETFLNIFLGNRAEIRVQTIHLCVEKLLNFL